MKPMHLSAPSRTGHRSFGLNEVWPPAEIAAGRRRFTIAAIVATAVTAVPFIWILWSLWGPLDPLRPSYYQDNFYDLQTRAMFHGHLSLANGSLGIEGFVHDGRTYTYFGLFPSIIRMPVMLVTSSLDGKLTPASMLVAWLVTALFSSLLIWRVRFLIRGDSVMGRMEATAFGVLIATILGGSVWMLLAETNYVFNEDIAWSVCLTVGSMFALLGVIERPSWRRVAFAGLLILCANLDRSTTGWACVVGAGLIAAWFGLGYGGRENRRWFIPVLAAGAVPLAIGCAVNYSKFGVLFGVSNEEQVWTHVNAYRRKFLAANHGAEEGTIFVPTNLLAYFRPDGLRFTSVFPFITLPAGPPPALGGVLFDRRYRTASLPASSPLLFLLSCWGLVTAFRPRPIGKVALTRLLLLAAGSAGAALMLWGYIAPRYLGDFVPFLVLASAVAMADIWRRLETQRQAVRFGLLGAMALVASFSIVANVALAVTPTPSDEWNTTQVLHYVEAQKVVGDLIGHPLKATVVRGNTLPPWAPADQLDVVGDCDGMYISTGEDFSTVPSEQLTRSTWLVVELGHAFQHTFSATFNGLGSARSKSLELVKAGSSAIWLTVTPTSDASRLQVQPVLIGHGAAIKGFSIVVSTGSTHELAVTTDPGRNTVEVIMDGRLPLDAPLVNGVPIRSTGSSSTGGTPSTISVVDQTDLTPQPTLCESLIH